MTAVRPPPGTMGWASEVLALGNGFRSGPSWSYSVASS
jgi:hypothetical protein